MTRALIFAALASAATLSAAQAQTIGTATTDVNIRSGPGPEHRVIGMIRSRQRANVIGCIEGSRWCQVDFRGRRGWTYSQYMTLSGQMAAVLPAPEVEVAATTPVVTYQTATPTVTYTAPAPAVTYQAPAPVVTYQTPAVTYQSPMPVVTYQSPATPAVTYTAPAPLVTYRAPATVVTTPAPTVAYRAPATTTTVVETTGVGSREVSGTLIAPQQTVYAATTPPPAFTPPRSVRTYVTTNPLDPVYLEGNLTVGAGIPGDIELSTVPNYRYQYVYVNDRPVLVDPATRRIVYVY